MHGEHDAAALVPRFELLVGISDLLERIHGSNWNIQFSGGHETCQVLDPCGGEPPRVARRL
jgi:hypothetical protein